MIRDIDVRTTLAGLVRGRERVLLGAGALVLLAGVYGAARAGNGADPAPAGVDAPVSGSADDLRADAADVDAVAATGKLAGEQPAPPPLEAADPATRVPRPRAIRGLYLNA